MHNIWLNIAVDYCGIECTTSTMIQKPILYVEKYWRWKILANDVQLAKISPPVLINESLPSGLPKYSSQFTLFIAIHQNFNPPKLVTDQCFYSYDIIHMVRMRHFKYYSKMF